MSNKEIYELLKQNSNVPGTHIEFFIKENELIPSRKPTRNNIIYWVYLNWCLKKETLPIPRIEFFRQLSKHFSPASRDRYRRYYVTSRFFNLHPNDKLQAEQEVKRENLWHARRRAQRASIKAKLRNRRNAMKNLLG